MDVDAFISALTNAIESESSKSGKSITETKKEQAKIAKKKEERAVEMEQKNKSERELEDVVESIIEYFQNNKNNLDTIKPILEKIKSLGYDKPQSISNLEDAKKILKLCK